MPTRKRSVQPKTQIKSKGKRGFSKKKIDEVISFVAGTKVGEEFGVISDLPVEGAVAAIVASSSSEEEDVVVVQVDE